ncbi:hypothetical protein B0H10DRAFT_1950043 [Mycena sp. CBHHK59/15]|nr:hypothetical protein B0H10DRAFT_1950043 [Mycena sp. CBHHK59/15]
MDGLTGFEDQLFTNATGISDILSHSDGISDIESFLALSAPSYFSNPLPILPPLPLSSPPPSSEISSAAPPILRLAEPKKRKARNEVNEADIIEGAREHKRSERADGAA